MPGFLLHLGATAICAHGGRAEPTAPFPRVTVTGQPIVTQAAPYSIVGCPFVAGAAPSPCVAATWSLGAARVTANGLPVLLQSSQAVCMPNGTPVSVLAVQTRVSGI